jgi:serine-type D-Ala-D-Ala carboxypeptidase (penicillin-binding protein 5/6)
MTLLIRLQCLFFFLFSLICLPVWALDATQKGPHSLKTLSTLANLTEPTSVPHPPHVRAKSYVLIDSKTQEIIAAKDPNQQEEPASLTKLMSLYLISDALKNKQIQEKDLVNISVKAWRSKGSRMFIREGRKVPVGELIHGIAVQSGNDATIAMAEYHAGSEDAFVASMNHMAKKLNLFNTHFSNPTGLPATDHYSTALDLAHLAIHTINDFPEYYKWYSIKSFTYNRIKQYNRNVLIWKTDYVDGLKTGFTQNAGYCLIASGKKQDSRYIVVLMGEPSNKRRFTDAQTLFSYGFRFFHTVPVIKQNEVLIHLPVYYGMNNKIDLGVDKTIYKTLTHTQKNHITLKFSHPASVDAPIKAGKTYGQVIVYANNIMMGRYPLKAKENIAEGSWLHRSVDFIKKTSTQLFA